MGRQPGAGRGEVIQGHGSGPAATEHAAELRHQTAHPPAAMAEQIERDAHVAGVGQPPRHVPQVVGQAEQLVDNQHRASR